VTEPRLCAGITRSGERCTQSAREGLTYCHHHDPDRAEERSMAASRAAKSRHQDTELGQAKARLKELADEVVKGELATSRGSVAAQLLGVFIRAVEQERKQKELVEFGARIQAIEQAQERSANSWGT
jgi:hypothetical protein